MRLAILLLLLFVGNFLNVVDRSIIGLFLPMVRTDLGLSATQAGLISGVAFIAVYSVVSVPIARVTDRYGARAVIAASVVLWSGFTAACGVAASFGQLFLARMAVGAAESAFVPAAYAALTFAFPKEKLGRAMSIFTLGQAAGLVLGYSMAGSIGQQLGWRYGFVTIGMAGVVIGTITWLAWPHLMPNRWATPPSPQRTAAALNPLPAIAQLMRIRAFALIVLAASSHAIATYGSQQWMPSLLQQSYGMTLAQSGFWMGIGFSSASIVGGTIAGFLIDFFKKDKMLNCMRLAAWTVAMPLPFQLLAFLKFDGPYYIGLIPAFFLTALYMVPTYYVVQRLVPDHMRASANAILLTTFTAAGLGLGPLFVGIGSDKLTSLGFSNPLGTSISLLMVANVISAAIYALVAREMRGKDVPESAVPDPAVREPA